MSLYSNVSSAVKFAMKEKGLTANRLAEIAELPLGRTMAVIEGSPGATLGDLVSVAYALDRRWENTILTLPSDGYVPFDWAEAIRKSRKNT